MNPFQKQLVAGDGQLFMNKPDLFGRVGGNINGPRPPAPQKVTVEEFEKDAMEIGRAMHEAVASTLFDEDMSKQRLKGRQGEGRVHRTRAIHIAALTETCPAAPSVVYIDGENGDGKIRALMEEKKAFAIKFQDETMFIVPDNHSPLSQLEFVQDRMSLPPEICECEFDPYGDGDPAVIQRSPFTSSGPARTAELRGSGSTVVTMASKTLAPAARYGQYLFQQNDTTNLHCLLLDDVLVCTDRPRVDPTRRCVWVGLRAAPGVVLGCLATCRCRHSRFSRYDRVVRLSTSHALI